MRPHHLRRWVCLVFMRHRNMSGDETLPRRAYQRGLFLDKLAENSELAVDTDDGSAFLLGVLSLMKDITGDNPESLFRGVPLRPSVWDALTGKADNDYARLLRYAEIYEKRDPRLTPPDIRSHLDSRQMDNI